MRTVNRQGLVEQTTEQMQELIRDGAWAVGERIPAEPELAAQLGVGRSTVREAVRALAHIGLLSVRAGDGTRVRERDEMTAVLGRRLGLEDGVDILEVRAILEGGAARLAARRRTQDDLDHLGACLTERERAWEADDVTTWVTADLEFHLSVVEAAHNPVLATLCRGFRDYLAASIASSVVGGLSPEAHIEHTTLLEAIRHRDEDEAAAQSGHLMEAVTAASQRARSRTPPPRAPPPGAGHAQPPGGP